MKYWFKLLIVCFLALETLVSGEGGSIDEGRPYLIEFIKDFLSGMNRVYSQSCFRDTVHRAIAVLSR